MATVVVPGVYGEDFPQLVDARGTCVFASYRTAVAATLDTAVRNAAAFLMIISFALGAAA